MEEIKQIVRGNNNDVTINEGLGVEDVYRLALKLFNENFPILQQQAACIVKERVDQFLRSVTGEFASNGFDNFDSFKNPDMQYALYESMKTYAKYGTNDLLKVLSSLIVNRAEVKENHKLKIALDDAIQMAQKMTDLSFNYLTMTFICKQTKIGIIKNELDLINFINQSFSIFPFDTNDFDYLNSIGCFVIDLDSPFDRLSKTYKIDRSKFDKMIPSSINQLPSDYSLSFPAIALAIINARNKSPDLRFDLNTWIK